MMPSFPENFTSLHAHEESNRSKCIEAIGNDNNLRLHFDALEASMNLIEHFARGYETEDVDDQVLQLLGIRLFNSAGASIKLLLAGYHQGAAAQARDVLETSFLVDLLASDNNQIRAWRSLPDEERKKRFGPIQVRMALDKRDGVNTKKRAEHYARLSAAAAHATPQGFRLLRPASGKPAFIGPFFNLESLLAVGSELALAVVPAASHFRRHFEPRALVDYEVTLHYLEGASRWMERFLGRPYDPEPITKLAALVIAGRQLESSKKR